MDDLPLHHLVVIFCSETENRVLSLSFLGKTSVVIAGGPIWAK